MKRRESSQTADCPVHSTVSIHRKVAGQYVSHVKIQLINVSPYLSTDTIEILEGVTLTIEADVTVNVKDRIGFGFLVHGELEAEGTSESPITFIVGRNWLSRWMDDLCTRLSVWS